jgi:hypothetical protein
VRDGNAATNPLRLEPGLHIAGRAHGHLLGPLSIGAVAPPAGAGRSCCSVVA